MSSNLNADVLDPQHSSPKRGGRTFTRDEIKAALAGNVQQAGPMAASDERYLLALAAAFSNRGEQA